MLDLRVICDIFVFGRKQLLEEIIKAPILSTGHLRQIGLKRVPPLIDTWLYSTPAYQFHMENFDSELISFLNYYEPLKNYLNSDFLDNAFLSISYVTEDKSLQLAASISNETIRLLGSLNLGLEMGVEVWISEKPFWIGDFS